jgi:hypothetical protein
LVIRCFETLTAKNTYYCSDSYSRYELPAQFIIPCGDAAEIFEATECVFDEVSITIPGLVAGDRRLRFERPLRAK